MNEFVQTRKEAMRSHIKQGFLMGIVCWIASIIILFTKHPEAATFPIVGGIIFPLGALAVYLKYKELYPKVEKNPDVDEIDLKNKFTEDYH